MLADLDDVTAADVYDRAADTLGRLDDDVVVLGHLECVEGLGLLAGHVENSLVDGVGDAVVDELRQDQAVFAVVEHLEGIGREGQATANIGIAGQDGIDVAGELGALILVDGVRDVRTGPLHEDLAAGASADAPFGGVAATGPLGDDAGRRGGRWAGRESLLGG